MYWKWWVISFILNIILTNVYIHFEGREFNINVIPFVLWFIANIFWFIGNIFVSCSKRVRKICDKISDYFYR